MQSQFVIFVALFLSVRNMRPKVKRNISDCFSCVQLSDKSICERTSECSVKCYFFCFAYCSWFRRVASLETVLDVSKHTFGLSSVHCVNCRPPHSIVAETQKIHSILPLLSVSWTRKKSLSFDISQSRRRTNRVTTHRHHFTFADDEMFICILTIEDSEHGKT